MDEQTTTEAPRTKVLANGSVYDYDRGRIVSAPTRGKITKENSHEFTRKRKEKTARLLRQAIVAETGELLNVPTTGSAAAVAAAGGILWREIVLSPDAYPRDRMEAWEKLGRHAGILADPREPADQAPGASGAELVGNLSKLVSALAAFVSGGRLTDADAVDATVTDASETTE